MVPRLYAVGTALWEAIRERARIDTRALAAMRIALGSILLVDLLLRARSLGAFYTDDGIFTRRILAEVYPVHPSLSIHALSGDAMFQAALFALAGVAAIGLAVGYRTRLATLASFVFLISLHARNPTVLNSGDVLLRRLLFFGLFVPLGARWSIDATRRAELRESVATLGSLALLAQVVLAYVVNAAAKVHGGLWLEGEAVAYVLHLDRFSVFLGPVIADVAPLATTLTWLWFGLLLVSWLLLVTTGMYRGILAAAVAGMHAGMVLTMDLGVFPFVSIAALLPFVHGAVWDRIEDRLPAGATEWRSTVGQSSNSRSALSRRVPSIGRFHTGVHAVVLVGLLLVTAMGVGLVPAPDGAPEDVSETSWRMFANPPTQDEWLVAVGTFGDGRRTDLLRDGPVRLDRPPDTGRFPNARWRKHLSRYGAGTPFPAALADYQCRRYADEELTRVRLVQASRPATRADGRVQTTDLGDFRCAGDGAVRRDDER